MKYRNQEKMKLHGKAVQIYVPTEKIKKNMGTKTCVLYFSEKKFNFNSIR